MEGGVGVMAGRGLTHVASEHVVGVGGDVPGQAKVTDLGHPAAGQQNVSAARSR